MTTNLAPHLNQVPRQVAAAISEIDAAAIAAIDMILSTNPNPAEAHRLLSRKRALIASSASPQDA